MSHEEHEVQLQLYIDDELNHEERSVFEGHLRSCSECSQKLHSLLEMSSLVRGMRQYRVPMAFNYAILRQLGFRVVPAWARVATAVSGLFIGTWAVLISIWATLPDLGKLPALVKAAFELPRHLDLIGNILEPVGVLLRAGAITFRSIGGLYLLTTWSLALPVLLLLWWLVNQRLRLARVVGSV